MEKLIEIVKSGLDPDFFDSNGNALQTYYEIGEHVLKNIVLKKDGKMILSLMSERAYERAKRLLDEESNRTGMNYDI